MSESSVCCVAERSVEPDGRFLGRIVASRLFTPDAMRGDYVWGVLRDEDDVPAVVKMRIDPKL